jgi:hypothetical protein
MPTRELEMLLCELESSCLEVMLVPLRRPANVGGCYRVASNRNATWYRQFCGRHLSVRMRHRRLPDTRIKRRDIVRILSRLSTGTTSRSKYAPELIALARRRAACAA